jgi:type IV secretion system protein VirB10
VSCQVTQDIYSVSGLVLLIERGATVFGEQTGGIKAGTDRAFILWTTVENPSGATIDLDSLGVDQSGAAGIPAFVDNKNGARFGAALFLSLFRDASAAAFNQGKDGRVVLANSQQAAVDFGNEALKRGIDIPPTGIVPRSNLVYVLVARNCNFESVYRVENALK